MFTGLVSDMGKVSAITPFPGGIRWTIEAPKTVTELKPGDSVNVSGACQTAETVRDGSFAGTSIQETLSATNFGDWTIGRIVNLELAMRASDRFGGHIVTGHIDTTGRVDNVRISSEGHRVDVSFDSEFDRWVLAKGSIAIDGVSLTVMVKKPGLMTVSFIPETVGRTTLGDLRVGQRVNLEFDMLVKAVVSDHARAQIDKQMLQKSGW